VVLLDSNPVGGPALASPSGALDDVSSLNHELPGLPFPDDLTFASGPLAYIEFNPTGAAKASVGAGGDSLLTITEGFVNSGSKPTPTSKTSAGTKLANVGSITVNSLVGRIKVTRP
jgi:hypothetical protein